MNKKIIMLFLSCFLILPIIGCGGNSAPDTNNDNDPKQSSNDSSKETTNNSNSNKDKNLTITDTDGEKITFDTYPEKLIVLSPSEVETVFMLGGEDKLIAIGEYANYPEETKNIEKTPTGTETNLEQIISLEPDCVILSKMNQNIEHNDTLKDAGINVVVIDSQTIDETYEGIKIIGQILNKENEAGALIENMEKSFEDLKENAKNKTSKTVYVEVQPLEMGLFTAGSKTFVHELLESISAENIFADSSGWLQPSEEQVINKNPEVIISTSFGVENAEEEIKSRSGWEIIKAVEDDQVYRLDPDLVRPGPRMLDGAKEMYNMIYGE